MQCSYSHIVGNMILLWAYSPEIEDAVGLWRFFILYKLVTMLSRIAAGPHSTVPNLGASGAIAVWLFHSGGAYLLQPQRQPLASSERTQRCQDLNPAVSGAGREIVTATDYGHT